MTVDFTKLPRLYVDQTLDSQASVMLSAEQAHYLKNVLRKQEGNQLRLFNGQDGEWLAQIVKLDKKSGAAEIQEQLKAQPPAPAQKHLFFSPIKKNRMDFLIEKSVELSVTNLHPILCGRSTARKINTDRIEAQIIEAAEQCERLDIPALHPLKSLEQAIQDFSNNGVPLYVCIERMDAKAIQEIPHGNPMAFLIGPEGGFAPEEIDNLQTREFITPVSLGPQILRSETAALTCLALQIDSPQKI